MFGCILVIKYSIAIFDEDDQFQDLEETMTIKYFENKYDAIEELFENEHIKEFIQDEEGPRRYIEENICLKNLHYHACLDTSLYARVFMNNNNNFTFDCNFSDDKFDLEDYYTFHQIN